jgi:hypothetical protein
MVQPLAIKAHPQKPFKGSIVELVVLLQYMNEAGSSLPPFPSHFPLNPNTMQWICAVIAQDSRLFSRVLVPMSAVPEFECY